FNDIQDPETRIQDQSILSMVFIAAAKLDFKILCYYRVYFAHPPEAFTGTACRDGIVAGHSSFQEFTHTGFAVFPMLSDYRPQTASDPMSQWT
ncbi:hypothetical protein D1BOALGB6SA_10102, partial [Olavius sp. associated proteobacterium Delta 1]